MVKNSKLTTPARPVTPASDNLATLALPIMTTLKRKVAVDLNDDFTRRTRSRATDIDAAIQSITSSSSMEVASDISINPIIVPIAPKVRKPMSIECKIRRELLKNKTRTCSACPAGNDAEFVHADLSTPICGNCNMNNLDDTFVTDESGQQLRCTWCGDGESEYLP